MTTTALDSPADGSMSGEPSEKPNRRLKMTFSGEGLKSVSEAAAEDRTNPGDFVRRAIKTVIYLKRMERRGYTVLLQNPRGTSVPLDMDLLSL